MAVSGSNDHPTGGRNTGQVQPAASPEALRQTAATSAIIEQAPIAICLVDADLRLSQVNAVARPVFGPLTNLEGRDLREVLRTLWPAAVAEEVLQAFVHTLATGESYHSAHFSSTRIDREGEEHYDFELHRITFPDGRPGVACYFIDISAHVLAQRALQANEQQLRATFNQAAVGMATAALSGQLEQVNHRFAEILGYTPEELRGKTFLELTHHSDVARTQVEVRRLLEGRTSSYALEKRYVRKNGSAVWSLTTVTMMKNVAGEPERFIGVIEDISLRKRAEEAGRESAQRLQLALDAGQLGDWTWNPQTDALHFGPRFAEIFGVSPQVPLTWAELRRRIHPEDRERTQAAVEHAIGTGSDYSIEYRIHTPTDATRWIAAKGRGIYSDHGEAIGMSGVVQDVTDLKLAAEALQDRERELSLIYNNVSDVIFYLGVDPDGGFRFLSVNQAFLAATGLADRDVVGKRVQDVIPSPSRELVLQHYAQAIAEKKTVRWEEVTTYPSGEKTGLVSVTPIFNDHGRCVNLIGTVHDLSERRHTEEARLQLASVVESSDDAILSMSLEAIVSTWNHGAERMFGYTADEIVGRSVTLLLPPDRINEEPAILERLKAGERIEHYETVRQRKDGTLLDVALTVSPIKDPHGRIIGASKIARDVTKRRTTEEALRASEQRFRDLADAMPQIVWTAGPDGRLDYFNRRWYDYTGFKAVPGGPEEGLPAVHPDDVEPSQRLWRESVASGHPFEMECRLRNRDGLYRWHLARALPQRNPAGKLLRWYGSSTDIHEQKLTTGALREEYAVTEHLNEVAKALASELDLANIVQIITDAGTRIIRAQFGAFFYNVVGENGAAYTLYTLSGIEREAFEKFPMPRATGLFGPTFRGEGVVRIADVRQDPRYGQNPPFAGMPEGHPPVTSYLAVPVFARSGEVLGGLFFGHPKPAAFTERDEKIMTGIAAQAAAAMDTARLYQAEQQARSAAEQANKAKDHFLATLSHELRTPLTPVLAILSGLGDESPLPEALAKDLATVRRNVELEARLIDDLLDLTRITRGKMELHCERIRMGALVENAITTCQRDLELKHLHLVRESDQTDQVLFADGARITQILWNLLRNSIKFTPEGGTITIREKVVPDSKQIVIEIQDTGIGMEPAQMLRMFDAFEQGGRKITQQFGGLGLGLAISKAIAEAHHGTIAGFSEGPNLGSLFILSLPLEACPDPLPVTTTPAPNPTLTPPPAPATGQRSARILIVEDHADTAAILSRMLRRTGYEVLHAGTIEDALKLATQEMKGAGLDLMMSDLSLPDGSGLDLMRELSKTYKFPSIALSGFGMDADRLESAAAGFSRHLTKPIDIAVVRRTIAELLPPPPAI